MRQIFEVEEKPYTSSLNICPEVCCLKGLGPANAPHPGDISFENDITIMLLYVTSVAKFIVPDWGG
jgi:hypothetical protein